jgi:3-oxoacyl-[acyl-carrier protein] reductase
MTTNNSHPFSLAGKVAWITGSSTGLGKVMAMQLGAAGAKVALNYANNEARANETFKQFQEAGYEGIMLRGSVIVEEEVNRMAKEIENTLGPIDILIVNATPDQPQMPIEEYTWEFYQSMLDFFVKSPYLLTRAVLPHMKAQRWGRIINIGSEVFTRGVPNGYLAGLPMKRWGVPKEVADTAVFLASNEASYVSGQNIAVNGAHTLG